MIRVRSYATTANFGIGFDIVGAALEWMWEETEFELRRDFEGLRLESVGEYDVPEDPQRNCISKIVYAILEDVGIKEGVFIRFKKRIKPACGLGSSGSSCAATVVGLCHLLHRRTEQIRKLSILDKIRYASLGEPDNHLDNVGPALLGKIVFMRRSSHDDEVRFMQIDPPIGIVPILLLPLDIHKVSTAEARKVLPKKYSMDVLKSEKSLMATFVHGLLKNNLPEMVEAVRGEVSVISYRNSARIYGVDAIALDQKIMKKFGDRAVVTPSGAGPALLAITSRDLAPSVQGMLVKEYQKLGHKVISKITSFALRGAEVVK